MRLFGIPIRFDLSAWFLVGLVSWYGFMNLNLFGVDDRTQLILGTVLILAGFVFSIIAHELAHALTARRYDVETQEIRLWGLGGAAMIRGDYAKPSDMFMTSIAGPVSSFVIAALGFALISIGDAAGWRFSVPGVYWAVIYLTIANVILGVFNLLPALPLDGGRALHAAIWRVNGNQNAAGVIAATVGMVLAIALGLFALLFLRDWMLVILAGFIYVTANAERKFYADADV